MCQNCVHVLKSSCIIDSDADDPWSGHDGDDGSGDRDNTLLAEDEEDARRAQMAVTGVDVDDDGGAKGAATRALPASSSVRLSWREEATRPPCPHAVEREADRDARCWTDEDAQAHGVGRRVAGLGDSPGLSVAADSLAGGRPSERGQLWGQTFPPLKVRSSLGTALVYDGRLSALVRERLVVPVWIRTHIDRAGV